MLKENHAHLLYRTHHKWRSTKPRQNSHWTIRRASHHKVKVTSFHGPLSAVKPFSHPLTYLTSLVIGLHVLETYSRVSLGKLLHSCILQPTSKYGAQEYRTCTDTALSGTNSHLGQVEPWRFISCALRNSH